MSGFKYHGPSGDVSFRDLRHLDHRNLGDWQPSSLQPRSWQPPVGHGVYLFIRFPVYSSEVAAQTVVLAKRYTKNYHGEFVGIARKIHSLSSGPRGRDEALLMYLFESHQKAERFFVSDKRFQQPDFPEPTSNAEAWTMVKYLDTKDQEFKVYQTYMLCYTKPRVSFHQYRDEVAQPLGALIEEFGGLPFVVQNVGVNSLRRHNVGDNTMVTLHLFKNELDCKNMMSDRRWEAISRKQEQIAMDNMSVFTIDHQACP